MSNTWLRGVILAVPLAAIGCSSESGNNTNNVGGATNGAGGSGTSTGGTSATPSSSSTGGSSQATGGTTSGQTSATGGKSTTGGSASSGGSSGTRPATGGNANTGGTKAGGGASATGGTKAGGGTSANVGGGATGGAATETGGTKANGGSAATGGTKANGGSAATGGATEAGGSAATGGTSSPPPADLAVTSNNNSWKTAAVTTGSGNADVTVNDAATGGQTWEGFGGAFNELGWKYLTSDAMKQEAIKLLFDEVDGANFTWGRIPMGSSDYGEIRYTYDDTSDPNDPVPSGETNRPPADTAMAKFSLARDDKYLIPYIKAAIAKKPGIRFWASPWTPPVWMKTGMKTDNGADSSQAAKRLSFFDGGSFVTNKPEYLTAYADYYKRFVEGYKDKGINVEVVSPQNEPGYDQNYPSCIWDKATYVSWIKALSTVMKPLNVKVMLGSMSNAGDGGRSDIDIANAVLADATAKAAVSMVGVQWGVLEKVVGGTTFGGLPIWASEHKCGNYPWEKSTYNNNQAPNDQAYGVESWGYIRDAITKGKVTSYNAWNMVLDKLGLGNDTSRDWKQNALLVADGGSVKTTPTYYVFRHFSQYVKPGAKVLTTTGGDAVAFKNPDGSVVTVLYNSGAAKSNYAVKVGSKVLQFSMPNAGWATVVSAP